MSRVIFMLTVVLLVAAATPALQEPKTGDIEIRAFDVLGAEIDSKSLEVELFTSDGKKVANAFHNAVAVNVPYGDYRLFVGCAGFEPERRNITVHMSRVAYHFTLEVGSIRD